MCIPTGMLRLVPMAESTLCARIELRPNLAPDPELGRRPRRHSSQQQKFSHYPPISLGTAFRFCGKNTVKTGENCLLFLSKHKVGAFWM